MTDLRQPYPETMPYETGFLDVGDGHSIYYAQFGNRDGIPVVCFHGGPGSHSKPKHARYFNPQLYRVILFDQRGCGLSTPRGTLENNTTAHLVADIEKLRTHLHIDRWIVFGGSWGSTLGIAYTVAHSSRVRAAVLNGIFLGSPFEARMLYAPDGLAAQMFPAEYAQFIELLTPDERADPLAAFAALITDESNSRYAQAVRHWSRWESQVYLMDAIGQQELEAGLDEGMASGDLQTIALFETAYISRQCFLSAEKILGQLSRLKDVPAYLFHGRLDMICPPVTAKRVHDAWPQSELRLIAHTGHDNGTPAMQDALIGIMDRLAA